MDIHFTPEEEAALKKLAVKHKLPIHELVKQVLFGDDPINLEDFKNKPAVVRCKLATQTTYSGGRQHRVAVFLPDDELEEGDSYWTPQGRYIWSGRLDGKERTNMEGFIMSPLAGMGLHLVEDLVIVESRAENIATLWVKALRRIQDADALDQPLWPLAPDADLVERCAAWIKWVRENPNTPSEMYREVCRAIGLSSEDHAEVRGALSWSFTAQSGYLVGDYPWPMMMSPMEK